MQPHAAQETVDLPSELKRPEPSPADTAVIDGWLADTSKALALVAAIDEGRLSSTARKRIIDRAREVAEPQVLDLFERYLPESQRTKRLTATVVPDAILSLQADARRGEDLFFRSTTLQCRNCHQINGQGKPVGPDLSHIGKDYDGYRLLDSIANPAREIKPEYTVYVVETHDGRVFTGIRLPGPEGEVVLKDANGAETRFVAAEIQTMQPQPVTLMPESLIQAMTAQQLADLIAYLRQLK
jgi:putative heme-binding domain-containing protein